MSHATTAYPLWTFFPNHAPPPPWAPDILSAFLAARSEIDSLEHKGVKSDQVLASVRPSLESIGFTVESGKKAANKIRRPVLFGRQGSPVVSYEVDAFEPSNGIVVEVEAGRGAANNADYRDLVRASLMVDAHFLVLAMAQRYRAGKSKWNSYEQAFNRLDAIYKSERLDLPLLGVLLVGY